MKIKRILTLFVVLTVTFFAAQAHDYKQLWKQVGELLNGQDLPQSALRQAQNIHDLAAAEGNTSQMMRASLFLLQQRNQLSADSFYVDISRLEQWAADEALAESDRAVLHSVLGDIYRNAAHKGRWSRDLIVPRPADLRQWTQLMYYERAFEHYVASLSRLQELTAHSTLAYEIFFKGKWSHYYFKNDLTHAIGRRAAQGLQSLSSSLSPFYGQTSWKECPLLYADLMADTLHTASPYDCPALIMEAYRRMLLTMQTPERTDARLLTEVSRLNAFPLGEADLDQKMQALEQLRLEYADNSLCAEVYLAMADIHKQQGETAARLRLLQKAYDDYRKYPARALIYNQIKEITLPSLELRQMENEFAPGEEMKVTVRYRNLTQFATRLYRLELPADSLLRYADDPKRLKRHAVRCGLELYTLAPDTTYEQQDSLFTFSAPRQTGVYLLEAVAEGKPSERRLLFSVSNLYLHYLNLPGGETEFQVLHRETGHPVSGIKLFVAKTFLRRDNKPMVETPDTLTTDKEGAARIALPPNMHGWVVRTETPDEKEQPYKNFSVSSYSAGKENTTHSIHLMTDRLLYRPGQTVQVKGFAYYQTPKDQVAVEPDKEIVVRLLDVQGKKLEQHTVRSNEFGSFTVEFVLPTSGLPGRYRVNAERKESSAGTSYIRVEEYKRPTFEVTFDPERQTNAAGDTVTLTGWAVTYAGTPVANAPVKYRIERTSNHRPLRGRFVHEDWSESGLLTTDSEGRFQLHLPNPPAPAEWTVWNNHWNIRATVTSLSGESREGHTAVSFGSNPLTLIVETSGRDQLKGTDHTVRFSVTRAGAERVETTVHYRLMSPDGRVVSEGTAPSNKELRMAEWDTQPSALYKLKAAVAQPEGRDSARHEAELLFYTRHETKVPDGLTKWSKWTDEEFAPGEPARLLLGTTEQEVYVMMDVFTKLKRIESRRFLLSDTVQAFTFDYLPKYGNAAKVVVRYLKNGKLHEEAHTITLKAPEKRLLLRWESFRDQLSPGQTETWTLSVSHPDGRVADAELLATMYDASLDVLTRHPSNSFRLQFPRSYIPWGWHNPYRYYTRRITVPFSFTKRTLDQGWRYADISPIFTDVSLRIMFVENVVVEEPSVAQADGMSIGRAQDVMLKASAATIDFEDAALESGTETDDADEAAPQGLALHPFAPRTNFNETAFFFPCLRTDSAGRTQFTFTLPESLTRWRFRAFAHTKELDYGRLEQFITARKQFMVQPNLPRFVRVGDETTVRATITNLTGKTVAGTARLELFDPATERVILTRRTSFRVAEGESGTVVFRFKVSNTEMPLPACRIVAEGEEFSDGEQRYLPVLDNRSWQTETVPLWVNGADTVKRLLNALFNNHSRTADGHRLTVEFTGNPAWMAVQALPVVGMPEDDNAFSIAAAWYARSMAAHIATSHPRIKAVFDTWRTADSETLQSELYHNEELRTLLVEETPWVAEAANETEQRRRIALLFDPQNNAIQREGFVQKLQGMQTPSGAWKWRKNEQMVSRHVTTFVVETLERLAALTETPLSEAEQDMLEKGRAYLDQQLIEEHEAMLRREKEEKGKTLHLRPSEEAVHYLYSQALARRTLEGKAQEAACDMVKRCKGLTADFSLYGRACATLILHHHGFTEEALKQLRSLLERTVCSPELGRYFDRLPHYYWRNPQIPTQVATLTAVSLLMPDDTLTVEQMKQWLLTQKRTQCWDTPLNTVDAVHALLMRGTDLLQERCPAKLLLDGKEVTSAAAPVAGMNYLKRTYTADELTRLPRTLTVENADGGSAWGAVYAQYFEEMERVTASAPRLSTDTTSLYLQPLTVERTLLVERTENGRTVQHEVTEKTPLRVGDRLISRLTVKADRTMEFVQLKDGRAACTEPQSSASGHFHTGSLSYYRAVKDASTLFFIHRLPKGTHIIDHALHIDRPGRYTLGPASIQCAYAPEFCGQTEGTAIKVGE